VPARDTQDERQLIHRCVEGDQQAFAELVRRHRPAIVSLSYRLSGSVAEAEDIAQDSFIRAWQALPRFRGDAAFRTWMYRIATNTALQYLRRRRPQVDIEELPLAASDDPEGSAVVAEQRNLVQHTILRLPAESRLVLVLREYHDLSYKEIAATLQVPLGTVMSRLHYARQWLREQLPRQLYSARSSHDG
jgi:RNA polymerase sigma-70 factor (ECF subfamily)